MAFTFSWKVDEEIISSTEDTFLTQHFLLAVRFTLVILFGYMLTDTDRHRRIDTRCVHILRTKEKLRQKGFVQLILILSRAKDIRA